MFNKESKGIRRLDFGLVVLIVMLAVAVIAKDLYSPPQVHATSPTAITVITPLGPNATSTQVGTTGLNFAFTAADATNGNSFTYTGHEVLIVWNSDSSAHTVTFSSAPDLLGRTGDITTYSVPATSYAAYNYRGGLNGWLQSDGTVHVTANSALIKFAPLYIQ